MAYFNCKKGLTISGPQPSPMPLSGKPRVRRHVPTGSHTAADKTTSGSIGRKLLSSHLFDKTGTACLRIEIRVLFGAPNSCFEMPYPFSLKCG